MWLCLCLWIGPEINRPRYSKRTENFKRPKNREDSSDLDENLTESIAAMRSIISKIFGAARLQKNCFQKFFHASCCLNIYRCFIGRLSKWEVGTTVAPKTAGCRKIETGTRTDSQRRSRHVNISVLWHYILIGLPHINRSTLNQ